MAFAATAFSRVCVGLWVCLALCAASPALADGDDGASRSGLDFEARIEALLREKGYQIIRHRDWDEGLLYRDPHPRIVVLDAPYRSIYGHRAAIEFLLIDGPRHVLIETKRQNSPGSVDEKLPYVYMNALANLPEREFVLVLSGDGWKDGAIDWIEARGADTDGFSVFRPEAFEAWLETGL